MYNENENRVDWTKIIKNVVIMIGGILLVLGIITMINKCAKPTEKNDNKTNEEVSLTKQLDEFESALLKYLTSENLPSEVNATKTIRLKILTNKGLATSLADKKNSCDTSESYAEVTRLKENYAIKLSLTCGKNKEYRILYAGCFENCKDGICKGEENSTGGVCSVKQSTPSNENDNKDNNNGTTDKNNSNNNNTNTNTNKPSTTTKPNNNNSSNNTNNNNSNTNTNTTTKKTLYEHKKCSVTSYTCESGTLDGDRCNKITEYTIYGNVITTGGITTTNTSKVTANLSTTSYFFNKSLAANSNYKFIQYNSNAVCKNSSGKDVRGCYEYKKYYCDKGTLSGNSCIITTTSTSQIKYSCEDDSYRYNSNTKTCTKVGYNKTSTKATPVTTCETMWTYSPYVEGWTRTGNTK